MNTVIIIFCIMAGLVLATLAFCWKGKRYWWMNTVAAVLIVVPTLMVKGVNKLKRRIGL
jgi:hypothetical protein